jgi:transposase-like protein
MEEEKNQNNPNLEEDRHLLGAIVKEESKINEIKGNKVYILIKDKLYKDMMLRKSDEELSREYGVSNKQIKKWKSKLFREEGELSDYNKKKLREEFISLTRKELVLVTRTLLKSLTSESEKVRLSAVREWNNYIKVQSDLLTKLGIFSPDQLDLNIKGEISIKNIANQVLETQKRLNDNTE